MNCKPGDMALIVRGLPENLGKGVTCLEVIREIPGIGDVSSRPVWRLDRSVRLKVWNGAEIVFDGNEPYESDENLLPIRPERNEEFERVQSMAFAIRNSRLSSHEHAGPIYFSTTREP